MKQHMKNDDKNHVWHQKTRKGQRNKNKWNLNLSRTQTYQQEKLEKTQKDEKDTKK